VSHDLEFAVCDSKKDCTYLQDTCVKGSSYTTIHLREGALWNCYHSWQET